MQIEQKEMSTIYRHFFPSFFLSSQRYIQISKTHTHMLLTSEHLLRDCLNYLMYFECLSEGESFYLIDKYDSEVLKT